MRKELVDLNKDGKIQTEEVVDFNNLLIAELIETLSEKKVIDKEAFLERVHAKLKADK